ncbi:MAG: hypothetical protein NTZ11_17435 [Gammaproteobacteria bacterium]|nr:hypothetical protein [Gammaproteobacteria bacterium]
MSRPIRFLTREDAEFMARNIVERTSVRGCVEYAGLKYSCPALLDWELRQREMGKDPKVEVRIDELDLSFAYIEVPERGIGQFKALSRQPSFTTGLSISELNRLKKAIKDKELADRLGRLSDGEALRLRTEFYAQLGRAQDPAALKRLTQLQDELARQRLQQADADNPPSTAAGPVEAQPKPPRKVPSRKTAKAADKPADPENVPAVQAASPQGVIPDAAVIATLTDREPSRLPQRKFKSYTVTRNVA